MRSNARFFAKSTLFYTVVTALYVVCLIYVGRNLLAGELWYDEAGQLFIAHGLNHWSAPLSADGRLTDALTANHDYNQDPGGYTVLLYLWCKISSNPTWLRLLSFIFFIGAIVFICLISFRVLRSRKLAYAGGLVIFALWGGNFAHEIRAYSMELCGLAYGIWMVLKFREEVSLKQTLLFSLALCFFITSRYTMLVIGGILSCFVLMEIICRYRKGYIRLSDSAVRVLTYSVPLLIVVFLIWKYQMSYQNPDAKALSYIQYVELRAMTVLFAALGLAILLTWRWQSDDNRMLIAMFAAINLCFVLLGVFKVLPWNITGNKGAVFMLTLNITLFNCAAYLLMRQSGLRLYVPYIILTCWGICMVGLKMVGIANTQRESGSRVCRIDEALATGADSIYVSSWDSPEIRYLYEFGSLKERAKADGYPGKFKFLRRDLHRVGIKKQNFKKINAENLDDAPTGTIVYLTNTYTDSVSPSYRELKSGLYIKQ